jgi:hypothetical protein
VPWIWPGRATGAGELLAGQIGGSPTVYAIAGLVGCGLLLTLRPVVYRTVETVQSALVVTLFSLLIVLAVLLVRPAGVAALLAGAPCRSGTSQRASTCRSSWARWRLRARVAG